MFKKIDVNGKDEHPLYTYLKSVCGPTSDTFEDSWRLYYEPKHVSDVRWNFEVFLISKDGRPLYRYSPNYPVSDIEFDIKQLVKPSESSANIEHPTLESYETGHSESNSESKESEEESDEN